MQIIPNQPINLDFEENCRACDLTPPSIYKTGDSVCVQLENEPLPDAVELVESGNFSSSTGWNIGVNWAISGGKATHTAGLEGVLHQSGIFEVGKKYRITLVCSDYVSGRLLVGYNTTGLTIGVGFVESEGVFVMYVDAAFLTGSSLILKGETAFQGSIDSVSVIEMPTNQRFFTLNSDFTLFDEINPSVINYTGKWVTLCVDIPLPNGCYYIAASDSSVNNCYQNYIPYQENLTQGGIGSGLWVPGVNAGTSINPISGGVQYVSSNPSGLGSLELSIELCEGKAYRIRGSMSNITDAQVAFTLNGNTSAPVHSNGNFDITVVAGAATNFIIQFSTTLASVSSFAELTELNVTVIADDVTPNYISQKIYVSDEFDCHTVVINACNDNDNMNFGFVNTGFSPTIRMEGTKKMLSYPAERSVFTRLTGNRSVNYFNARKHRELKLSWLAEFTHDFLASLRGYDHVYLDGVEIVIEGDDYEPDVDEVTLLATSNIEYSVKQQRQIKVRYSAEGEGCGVEGSASLEQVDQFGATHIDSAGLARVRFQG